MTQLYIISVNHNNTSADQRLSLKLSDGQWEQLSTHMSNGLGARGMVLLQTCNRIEIIYENNTNENQDIIDTWVSIVDHNEISEQQFDHYDGTENSINYILRTSLGFHSAIYGDDQILSQLKVAFESARSHKNLSSLLERAYQSMMRTHKQVCRETAYKSQTVSLAYQALKSVRNIAGASNLRNKNILIIGAGDMAKQVLKYIPKFTFNTVTITNRTASKASDLATQYDLQTVDYNTTWSDEYHIVISCVDQGQTRLSELKDMELYIDLSLSSTHVEDLHIPFVLLEDLQEIITAQNNRRMACIDQVEGIIKSNQSQFVDWYNRWLERSTAVLV